MDGDSMNDQDEPVGEIICGRAKELDYVTEGATLDNFCGKCGERVVMSLSGQRQLKERKLLITRTRCFRVPTDKKVTHEFAAGTAEDVLKELATPEMRLAYQMGLTEKAQRSC